MSDRETVLADLPAEVGGRLDLYVDLLRRWQATLNLVAPSTLPQVWTRHVADSLQVQAAVPDAKTWVDFGSGAGFPGLVTAIVLAGREGARVHCVESDKRKAAFLRAVARETGAPATIHAERIERFVEAPPEGVEAISARALAPLPRLLAYGRRLLETGAIGVFPQGETAMAELTRSEPDHRFRFENVPSRLNDGSSLVIVRASRA